VKTRLLGIAMIVLGLLLIGYSVASPYIKLQLAGDVLQNGGFENGLDSWQLDYIGEGHQVTASSSGDAHSGTKSALISCTAYGGGGETSYITFTQWTSLDPNAAYKLNFWYKSTAPFDVYVFTLDNPNFNGMRCGPASSWTQASMDVGPTGGGGMSRVGFDIVQTGTVTLDDVELGTGVVVPPEEQTWTLTVSVAPEGAGSTSPSGTQTISVNSFATVTATASQGYTFKQWLLDDVANTANPITVPSQTVGSTHTLIAVFEAEVPPVTTWTLIITVDPAGTGVTDPSGTQIIPAGQGIEVTASSANSGFQFRNWLFDGVSYNSNPINIPIQADGSTHTLIAIFESIPPKTEVSWLQPEVLFGTIVAACGAILAMRKET
jgi:hypothetical protein